tara:strand:- start:13866 stop:13982 length:117 start_codon:yes stop_codon:yes gene_type:complete
LREKVIKRAIGGKEQISALSSKNEPFRHQGVDRCWQGD